MKVGILAGGAGTRLAEETVIKPKPMVEIGGRPILWHIMSHYAHYGFKEFVIALGYKGEIIKQYMVDRYTLSSNVTVNFANGSIEVDNALKIDWNIELIDTGLATMTGGRIKRLAPYVNNETFMLTWGDGVSDIDLHDLLRFHRAHGKLATLTAVRPPARYGHMEFDGDRVAAFTEKPQTAEGWINGAFFVLEPAVFDYIDGDDTQFEQEPLERLAREGQLMAYKHTSFWQCMDTMRDKHTLQTLWDSGNPPWIVGQKINTRPRRRASDRLVRAVNS
jgi:glucose-1-phosphate cytidylyltransferase